VQLSVTYLLASILTGGSDLKRIPGYRSVKTSFLIIKPFLAAREAHFSKSGLVDIIDIM